MAESHGVYCAGFGGLSPTGSNDWCQIRNGTGSGHRVEILEIQVWQTGSTTPGVARLSLVCGDSGTGTNTLTKRKIDEGQQNSDSNIVVVHSPSGNVANVDRMVTVGWYKTSDFLWMPPPKMPFIVGSGHHFAMYFAEGGGSTGVGFNIVWEEYGV